MTMIKADKLINIASLFSLKAEASIRSDMAKRIMYSILPSVATKSEIALTDGAIDYKALESAIEGRKDIIKYGVRSCIKELKHYRYFDALPNWIHDIYQMDMDPLKYESNGFNIENVINLCIKSFNTPKGWDSGYGGFLWEKLPPV